MAIIPQRVKDMHMIPSLIGNLCHQGKVRNTYDLTRPLGCYLVVATNRLSIFDFVLPVEVPLKGQILTALTHFWLTKVLKDFPNHLIDYHRAYEELKMFCPEVDLTRSLLVNPVKMMPYELIFRHHIGGSIFKGYLETGLAAGHEIPIGLPKWSKLGMPILTPSTKSESGHDQNLIIQEFKNAVGTQTIEDIMALYGAAYAKAYAYAAARGILILDTKFEGSANMIADEVITPDSSRFVQFADFENSIAKGCDPAFYDKEQVREWGRKALTPFLGHDGSLIAGIHKLDPENPEHDSFVHSLVVPEEVISDTASRYADIFEWLVGMPLPMYQNEVMGI